MKTWDFCLQSYAVLPGFQPGSLFLPAEGSSAIDYLVGTGHVGWQHAHMCWNRWPFLMTRLGRTRVQHRWSGWQDLNLRVGRYPRRLIRPLASPLTHSRSFIETLSTIGFFINTNMPMLCRRLCHQLLKAPPLIR